MKDTFMTIRINKRELDKIKEEAKDKNLSVSNYVRMVIFGYDYIENKEKEYIITRKKKFSSINDSFDFLFPKTILKSERIELEENGII